MVSLCSGHIKLFSTHSLHDQYIALGDTCKTTKVLLIYTRHFATQFWTKKDLTVIVSTPMWHSAQAGWLSGHRRRAAFWTFLFMLIKASYSVLQTLVSGSLEKEPSLAHPLSFHSVCIHIQHPQNIEIKQLNPNECDEEHCQHNLSLWGGGSGFIHLLPVLPFSLIFILAKLEKENENSAREETEHLECCINSS